MTRQATGIAAATALTLGIALAVGVEVPPSMARAANQHQAGTKIQPPVATGRLRIAGQQRDGGTVAARGLRWRPGKLPAGDRLLSFEVGYSWQACAGGTCAAGADATATPFAARHYVVGHADTGRRLRVTETATEVVQTTARNFTFKVRRVSRAATAARAVTAYPRGRWPASEFLNGLPEAKTGSEEEYFQVDPPHYNRADGPVTRRFRIDHRAWQAVPARGVFFTGTMRPGRHRVTVLTSDRAGRSTLGFSWRVVPLVRPVACRGACWYPPHLNSSGHPMRWDWQIGRTFPLKRTGRRAVDIYDIDGFLTTKGQVHRIRTSWPAATLAHPRTVCYLDLAWEDYRPDGSPAPAGSFPAAALGKVYYGYPEERWVDFRQLDALKPMLTERIAMCARKGFDAVELDDIDSFDPPSTTGFYLTPGDAQNYLAFAFNLIHAYGMTAMWKNNPALVRWGARYADGAVVEECFVYHECGSWHAFTSDKTRAQPTGKWVGEAEYGADHYVCDPGKPCKHGRSFAYYCRRIYGGKNGYAAVKFDVDLDGRVFYPCPRGR
ncbi:MAG TPA: endo alpha-1,4 polygalactosaminidase [Streptosporangiaceae bacterium]|nr:endo alpha-1,4 polygalactosaminidase [Streptosporangiaceae bacterium]